MNILVLVTSIIVLILLIALLAWQIKKNGLRSTVIDLIVEAEGALEDNQEKFERVVTGVINKLPFPFNFIPASSIKRWIQKVFDEVKIALDYREEK